MAERGDKDKTEGHRRYARALFLLMDGGKSVVQALLSREVQKSELSIKVLLEPHKVQLNRRFSTEQLTELFPTYGEVKTEDWSLPLLTGVLLELGRTTLTSTEKRELFVLRNVRDELISHMDKVHLDEVAYKDLTEQLEEALNTLTSELDPGVHADCKRKLERYLHEPLHLKPCLEDLEWLCDGDKAFEDVQDRLKRETETFVDEIVKIARKAENEGRSLKAPKIFKYNFNAICSNEGVKRKALDVLVDVSRKHFKHAVSIEEKSDESTDSENKAVSISHLQSGESSESQSDLGNKEATDNERNTAKDSAAHTSKEMAVTDSREGKTKDSAKHSDKTTSQETNEVDSTKALSVNQGQTSQRESGRRLSSNEHSVQESKETKVLKDTKLTEYDAEQLVSETRFQRAKEKFEEIVDDIKEHSSDEVAFETDDDLTVVIKCTTLQEVMELLYYMDSKVFHGMCEDLAVAVKEELKTDEKLFVVCEFSEENMQKNLEAIRNENVQYTRSINLAMKVNSVQGLLHIWEMFEGGKAQNQLNNIAEALSDHVGSRVNLQASLDLEQFRRALEDTVAQLEAQEKEEQEGGQSGEGEKPGSSGTDTERDGSKMSEEDKKSGEATVEEASSETPAEPQRHVEIISVSSGGRQRKMLFDKVLEEKIDDNSNNTTEGQSQSPEQSQKDQSPDQTQGGQSPEQTPGSQGSEQIQDDQGSEQTKLRPSSEQAPESKSSEQIQDDQSSEQSKVRPSSEQAPGSKSSEQTQRDCQKV